MGSACRRGSHAGKIGVQAYGEHTERTVPHRRQFRKAPLIDKARPGMHTHYGFRISQRLAQHLTRCRRTDFTERMGRVNLRVGIPTAQMFDESRGIGLQ